MLRDTNQNVAVNRLNQSNTNTTAAAGITTLTAASSYSQTLIGTGTQTYRMPDTTTLTTGVAFVFNNNATGTLTLQDYSTGSIGTITTGGAVELVLLSNSTVAGTWDVHGYLPENVTWGTNALNLGSTVITNGTWNGGTITSGYGGTGLTTFAAANNALYSTSSSALAAGTLPIAAGGTAVTSFTANGIVYGNGTSALGVTAAGTTGQVLIGNTGSAPTWGALSGSAVTTFQTSLSGLTPSSATSGVVTLAGTLGVTSGGTGATTFTAYGVLTGGTTSTGAVQSVVSVGTSGQVLVSNGASALPTFQTVSAGASISNDTSTASTLYPLFAAATSGTPTTIYTSNAKYLYKPSTGDLTASQHVASNGLMVNNATIATSYTIPAGYNASSVGPVSVASGVSVTVPSGSRWVVL
jgi:hypothetical protein